MVQAYTVQRKSAENASKSTSICFKLSKVQTVYIFTSISDKCASVLEIVSIVDLNSTMVNILLTEFPSLLLWWLLKVSQEVVQF